MLKVHNKFGKLLIYIGFAIAGKVTMRMAEINERLLISITPVTRIVCVKSMQMMPSSRRPNDQCASGHLTANINRLRITGDYSKQYVTDSGAAVVTQKRI